MHIKSLLTLAACAALASPTGAAPLPFTMFGVQTHHMSQDKFFPGSGFGSNYDPNMSQPVLSTLGTKWIRDGSTAYTGAPHALVYLPSDSQTTVKAVLANRATLDSYLKLYDDNGFKVIFTIQALSPKVPNYSAYNQNYLTWTVQLVEKHKSIYAIEFHNEPASTWPTTPQDYVTVYSNFAYALHNSKRPDVKTLGCGGCSVYLGRSFTDGVYKAGLLSFTDGVSLHPYNNGGKNLPPEIDQNYGHGTYEDSRIFEYSYFQSFNLYNKPFELDYTEVGYSSVAPDACIDCTSDDATQAAYLVRLLIEYQDLRSVRGLPINSVEFYNFKNDVDPKTDSQPKVSHNFGLTNFDLSPKPSFTAYQYFLRAVPNSYDIVSAPSGTLAKSDTTDNLVQTRLWARKSDGALLVPIWRCNGTTPCKASTSDFNGNLTVTIPDGAAGKRVAEMNLCSGQVTMPSVDASGTTIRFATNFGLCPSLAVIR